MYMYYTFCMMSSPSLLLQFFFSFHSQVYSVLFLESCTLATCSSSRSVAQTRPCSSTTPSPRRLPNSSVSLSQTLPRPCSSPRSRPAESSPSSLRPRPRLSSPARRWPRPCTNVSSSGLWPVSTSLWIAHCEVDLASSASWTLLVLRSSR